MATPDVSEKKHHHPKITHRVYSTIWFFLTIASGVANENPTRPSENTPEKNAQESQGIKILEPFPSNIVTSAVVSNSCDI